MLFDFFFCSSANMFGNLFPVSEALACDARKQQQFPVTELSY
jgi:hypothetical protein